ncbi:DUF4870 domain-containing protein, partial [Bacillus sp. JJ1764]|uniref:DUF4870 domain-containing protein n=1 Tax=Bacillus sp. JJ1764 TaxID=3122964 RepID=UPI002FFFBF61
MMEPLKGSYVNNEKKEMLGGSEMVSNDEKMLAAVLYVVSFFAPVVGPLIIWLLKRDQSSFIDYH